MITKKYVAFDIDGTVFSSEKILYPAYELTVEEFNRLHSTHYAVPSEESIFHLVGKPSKQIYKELFPEFTTENIEVFAKILRESLVVSIYNGNGIYYGNIVEIIKKLGNVGYELLVASNGSFEYVSAVLDYAGLLDVFEEMKVIDPSKNILTKGDILKSYQDELGFQSKDLIMIGDRTSDIDAAKHIDSYFVGTLYGHGEESEIKDADLLIDNVDNLEGAIDAIFRGVKVE